MAGAPDMPKPQPPTTMPLPDDLRAKASRRAAQNRLIAAQGRQATDHTDDNSVFSLGNNTDYLGS